MDACTPPKMHQIHSLLDRPPSPSPPTPSHIFYSLLFPIPNQTGAPSWRAHLSGCTLPLLAHSLLLPTPPITQAPQPMLACASKWLRCAYHLALASPLDHPHHHHQSPQQRQYGSTPSPSLSNSSNLSAHTPEPLHLHSPHASTPAKCAPASAAQTTPCTPVAAQVRNMPLWKFRKA